MSYVYGKGVLTKLKQFKTKFVNLTTAFVLAVTSLSGIAPLFMSSTVEALPASGPSTLFNEQFNSFPFLPNPNGMTGTDGDVWSWGNVSYTWGYGTPYYLVFMPDDSGSATVTLPLSGGQIPTKLQFDCYDLYTTMGLTSSSLQVTPYAGSTAGATTNWCSGDNHWINHTLGLSAKITSIKFSTSSRSYLGLDNVKVTAITPASGTDAVDHIAFTSGTSQTIDTDTASAGIDVQAEDDSNAAVQLDTSSNMLKLTSTSSTGQFSENGTSDWTTPGSEADFTWNKGWSHHTVYYKDATGGNYTLTATLSGKNGKYSWPAITTPITVGSPTPADTTAPSMPTLLTPVNRGYEKSNDFYFDWTDSSDTNSVTYEFQSSQNPHTTNGVLDTAVWDNLANGNNEQKNLTDSTIHSTGASDGTWYWQVRAIDAAGNKSAWTAPWKMTIDTHGPSGNITSPSVNSFVNTRQTANVLTVKGTSSDNLGLNRVLVQLLTSQHGAIQNKTVYLSGTSDDWQAQFNTKDLQLADGTYALVASFDDNAGNVYKTSYVDFTLDNTKPVAKFTSDTSNPIPNGYYHGNFDVGYEVSDNFKLKSVDVSLFDTNPAHSNHWAAGCYDNGAETGKTDTGTCTVHLPANLPDGTYQVRIQGQDAAGLYTVAATRTITVDNNAFNLGGYVFNNQNQDRDRDSGEETMPGWTLRLYDQDWNKLQEVTTKADGTYKFSTLHDAGTYYVCEVMQPGWNQVKSDWAGTPFQVDTVNQSSQSDEGPFCSTNTYTDQADRSADRNFGNVDTQKPTIEFIDPSIDDSAWTNQDFQVSFHAYDNYKLDYVNVGLRDNSNPDVTKQWKAGCSYPNINAPDLTATCMIHLPDQSSLPDGTYTVQIGGKAQDAPYWTVSKTRTVHIDRTPPAIEIDGQAPQSLYGKSAGLNLHVIDNNVGSTYIYHYTNGTLDASPYKVYGNDCGPSADQPCGYFNIKWLPDGTYDIDHVDLAGNISTVYTITIDSAAPSLTTNTYSGTDTTPTITGTTSEATDVVTVDSNTATVNATANSNGSYDWSYTLPTQTVGTHTVTVTSTDLAGNATQGTAKVIVTAPQSNGGGQPGVTITPSNDQHTVTPPQNQNLAFTPQVLGASTATPNTLDSAKTNDKTDGQVKGDQTTNLNTGNKDKTITNSSNFLGLGWWWLLVLAVILSFFWFVLGRTNSDDKKA